MANRHFLPTKDTVRAKESDHAQAKDGGGERHLLAGSYLGFNFTSYIKFDPDWAGVEKMTKAFLVVVTDENAHEGFPSPNAGVKVFRLNSEFPDPNEAQPEGEFAGRYPVEGKDPDSAANGTVLWGEGEVSRIDITALVADMAPKSVRRPNGKPGGSKPHHGFAIERRTTSGQPNPRMCVGGKRHPDTNYRPFIELIYDPVRSPNTVTTVAPTGNVSDINSTSFEGTFELGANQPEDIRPARWDIELYKAGGSDRLWSYGAAATPSDAVTLTCTVPLSLVATTDSRYRFVSGQGYEWRLRATDNKSRTTAWSGRRSFGVLTNPPELTNLRPSTDPGLETLNNVFFRADYSDPDGNPLARYQVQVRTQTSPTDPVWADAIVWDSGPMSGAGFGTRTPGRPTEIKQPYEGEGLEADSYSWRIRAWDTLEAESVWEYADFVLTKGWEPDPGDVELLTGYANRRLKARVLIRGMKNDVQTLLRVGDPDSGSFKLTYDGERTGAIPHNASASEVETELRALSNIGPGEVNVTKPGTNRWVVRFGDHKKNRPKLVAGQYISFADDERIDVYSDRAPGIPIAIIEDASNVGASEMYNSGGEFYFSLPAVHPQVPVIEPYQTHYALEHFRGESWKEVAAGYITDFDATDNDVVFYGQDYMAILGRQVDERFNLRKQADAVAKLWPETGGGSKYVDRRIHVIIEDQLDRSIHDVGSPLAFFDRAEVPVMDESISIFVSFKERLPFIAGLIESHRAGTGRRTRIYARRTGPGAYEWKVKENPGKDKRDLRMEYGGLVQGFRVIPFGDFATRLNAIGRLYNKTKLEYYVTHPPASADEDKGWYEETYGRFAQATSYEDISDTNDLRRRAKQRVKRLSRVGKALALNIRPGSFSIKDGWDICDSILVDIRRGVVDTSRMGSGLWTIWGWAWELKPDGQELITLSVLPKEDASSPDEDLIASRPIHSDATWEAGDGLPPEDSDADFYHDNDTGKNYKRDDDGDWEDMDPGPYSFGQMTDWDTFSREDVPAGGDLGDSELDGYPWSNSGPATAVGGPIIVATTSGATVVDVDGDMQVTIALPPDSAIGDYYFAYIRATPFLNLQGGIEAEGWNQTFGTVGSPWFDRRVDGSEGGELVFTIADEPLAEVVAVCLLIRGAYEDPDSLGLWVTADPGVTADPDDVNTTIWVSPVLYLTSVLTNGTAVTAGPTGYTEVGEDAGAGIRIRLDSKNTVAGYENPDAYATSGVSESYLLGIRGTDMMVGTDGAGWFIGSGELGATTTPEGDIGTELTAGNNSPHLYENLCYMDFTLHDLPGPAGGRCMLRMMVKAPGGAGLAYVFLQLGHDVDTEWWSGLTPTPTGGQAFIVWGTNDSVLETSMTWEEAVPYRMWWWMDAGTGLFGATVHKLSDPQPEFSVVPPEVGVEEDGVRVTWTFDMDGDGRIDIDVIGTEAGPQTGQTFKDHEVGEGNGVNTTFVGFPTQDGTALWYIDGVLTKPDFYLPETGGAVFDRPPAYGAKVTQTGTAR